MHKSVYYCTSRKTVNKVKLLFIYVIFCFDYQTIAFPTVRIACAKPRIYELTDGWIVCLKLRIDEFIDRFIVCYKLRIYELQIGELQDKNHEFTNYR